MRRLFLFFSWLIAVLGCHGSGPESRAATFDFSAYFPLTWTFYEADADVTASSLPQANMDGALMRAYTDLSDAQKEFQTISVLQEYNAANGASTTVLYVPIGIRELSDSCQDDTKTLTAASEVYVPRGNTLYYQCIAGNTSPVIGNVLITISSPQLLHETIWKAVGKKVQKKLEAKSVIFETPISLNSQSDRE